MATADLYEQLAPYYDRLHEELVEDLPFWVALAGEGGGPVLELGCGSGRVLQVLAAEGFAVTGLDSSPAMLALARARLGAAPARAAWELARADMTDFRLPGTYRLILAAHNTWTHLDDAAQGRALARARRYLASSGKLALDLPNPLALPADDAAPEAATIRREFVESVHGHRVLAEARSRWLAAESLMRVHWSFAVHTEDGKGDRRFRLVVDHHVRYPHEMELALERADLRLHALYGDYERAPFGAESERLIVVAEAAA